MSGGLLWVDSGFVCILGSCKIRKFYSFDLVSSIIFCDVSDNIRDRKIILVGIVFVFFRFVFCGDYLFFVISVFLFLIFYILNVKTLFVYLDSYVFYFVVGFEVVFSLF